MEIDNNISPLYNQGDWDALEQYSNDWIAAKARGNKEAMQLAHDNANAIRLKYADTVERIDFINGGTTRVNNEGNIQIGTYLKGELSAGIFLKAGLEATIKDSTLKISFVESVSGTIGAQASLTGGTVISSGEVGESRASAGIALGYIAVGESKVTTDLDDGD